MLGMVRLLSGCLLLALSASGNAELVTLYSLDDNECIEVTIDEKSVDYAKSFDASGLTRGTCSDSGFSVEAIGEELSLHIPFVNDKLTFRRMRRSPWDLAKVKAEAFLAAPLSFFRGTDAFMESRKRFAGMSPMQTHAFPPSSPGASEGGGDSADPLKFLKEIADTAGVEVRDREADAALDDLNLVSEEHLQADGQCCGMAKSLPEMVNWKMLYSTLPEKSNIKFVAYEDSSSLFPLTLSGQLIPTLCSSTIPWDCCHRTHTSNAQMTRMSTTPRKGGVWAGSEILDCLAEKNPSKADADVLTFPAKWYWVHKPVLMSTKGKNFNEIIP